MKKHIIVQSKQFGELKDQVTVEQILQVVFMDSEPSSPVSAEI